MKNKMDKVLTLEINRDNNNLTYILKTPDVICSSETITVSMENAKLRCTGIIEILNKESRVGAGVAALEKLRTLGQSLWDDLICPGIKDSLRNTDAEYLVLELSGNLVHIPWELVCMDNTFLCERFCMGRGKVKVNEPAVRGGTRRLYDKDAIKMMILANPKGDLAGAGSEGWRLHRLMNREKLVSATLYSEIAALYPDLSSDWISAMIRQHDFVHFAGHAFYDAENPDNSGWKLNGINFSAGDIRKMEGGAAMPALVFSNACQSARTEEWEWNPDAPHESFGFANAFLRAGVKHFIGTFWEISDEQGGVFSDSFYKNLLSGQSIGKALRKTRKAMIEEGGDITWASYLLYGDPTYCYFHRVRGTPSEKIEQKVTNIPECKTHEKSLKPSHSNKLKWAAVVVFSFIIASGMIYRYIHMSDRMRFETWRYLSLRIEEKHQLTNRRFAELTELCGPLKPPEKRTIAVVYNINLPEIQKNKIILSAIQAEILEKTEFKVIEQESLDVVIENLIRIKPDQLQLKTPKFLMFMEVYHPDTVQRVFMGNRSLVLIRIVDTESNVIKGTIDENIKFGLRLDVIRQQFTPDLILNLKRLADHPG